MAPFPPSATCLLPMSAKEYYCIQDQPAFRSLLAQARVRLLPLQASMADLACVLDEL